MIDKPNKKKIVSNILLLTFLFTLVFYNESVAIPLSPYNNSVVSSTEDTIGATDSLQLANTLLQNKKYEKALNIALSLYNNASKKNDSIKQGQYSLLIATIFKETNNYSKALSYYNTHLKLVNNNASVEHISGIKIKISVLLYNTNQMDAAVRLLENIIQIPDTTKEIELIKAKAYNNLSAIYIFQDRLVKAENNAYNAINIYEKHNEIINLAKSINNLASVFMQQKRYKDAKRELLDALSLISNEKASQSTIKAKTEINTNLAYTLYKLKDYRTFEYSVEAFDLTDSIHSAEMKLALAKIESEFNAENERREGELNTARERSKKEKAQSQNTILGFFIVSLIVGSLFLFNYFKTRQKNRVELLQSESREKILNATLDGKEKERKMIAETLHHSVSALLSSANLHLQAAKMQLKEPIPEEINKAQRIVNEAGTSIRNLSHSLVSNVLLKFGLSYALQELTEKLSNSQLEFICHCEPPLERFDPGFELKINTIIDELLNNIIKHSDASKAVISIKKDKTNLSISIKDNGRGFNPDLDKNKNGLGLNQIETRIKRMLGVFKINSIVNKGTNIFIYVPIVKKEV